MKIPSKIEWLSLLCCWLPMAGVYLRYTNC